MKNNLPIQLAFEEAKKEIIKNINDVSNNYNISYFLLKFIIQDIIDEVEEGRLKELSLIKHNMNKKDKEVHDSEKN